MAVFLSDHHHHHYRGKERRAEGLRREKSWDRAEGMSWQNAARHGMCMVLAFDIGMVWHGARGTGTAQYGTVWYGKARQRHESRCSRRFCSLFVRYLLLPGVFFCLFRLGRPGFSLRGSHFSSLLFLLFFPEKSSFSSSSFFFPLLLFFFFFFMVCPVHRRFSGFIGLGLGLG